MNDIIDVIMFVVLLGLLGGIIWFIKLLSDVDETKVNRYCKKSPSFVIKANSISDKIPDKYKSMVTKITGSIPPNDVPINFKLNC